MRHDSLSEDLRRIAASKIQGYGRELSPEQREAAVALLADLYATGLRHGVTPEDWAAVAGLDIESLDAIRWRDRVNRSRPKAERPFDHEPTQSLRSEQRGRELP
jgi:hypothetical protein